VNKSGQGVERAWCPSGYHVLSGWVKLNGWDNSYFYPASYYYRDDGMISSGTREGWQGTQLLDNDPSIPLTITVSARCAGY
jgi:hypothetical protein